MPDFDVVVIGAGVMGAATAERLTRQGRRVLLLEQFALGHNRGSSHGSARIFRRSYPDPAYVQLTGEALALWRELEGLSGEPLLEVTGGIDVGAGSERNAAALEACDVAHQLLDSDEAGRRFPGVAFGTEGPVLFQPDAGVLAAERTTAACVALAVARGAEVREGRRVTALREDRGGVQVQTTEGSFEAEAAVVTAGAWTLGLVRDAIGVDLQTWATRETVAYFRLGETRPPTVIEWGSPQRYALPTAAGELRAAEHITGPVTDPDLEGVVDEASVARVAAWVRERFPGVAPEPLLAETCIYTMTADEHFILERHGRIVIGSACSGHGFKFAPATGSRLAALATEAQDGAATAPFPPSIRP